MVGYGRQELALARLTYNTADELMGMALKLERQLRREGRRRMAASLGNLAADALAQIAAANLSMKGDYFDRLEALKLLAGARKALSDFQRMVGVCVTRGDITTEVSDAVIARTEETRALVMALLMAVRVSGKVGAQAGAPRTAHHV